MADDVLVDKAAIIERCVARARDEYGLDPQSFGIDPTRHDAAVLNILRANAAALDMGHYVLHRERLGVPRSTRDVFDLLAAAGWIDTALAARFEAMIDYRDTVIHDDQTSLPGITATMITTHLDDFLVYAQTLLRKDGDRSASQS